MTAGFRIFPRASSANPALLARLAKLPVSNISDNLQRHHGARLKPFHRSGTVVGTAFTVKTRPGDNLVLHKAIDAAAPGDVIVVDAGGALEHAMIGELMASWAHKRGVAGFVIDGAIRDVAAFRASDFPCFARGVIHRGPYKTGPGIINVPVSIGGAVISPGDIVVGDEDGVVSFPPSIAETLIAAVQAQVEREDDTLKAIREGRYESPYARLATQNTRTS